MKSFLIAALTVGATIAGVLLYTERKIKQKSRSIKGKNDTYLALEKENVEPLAIQSIP